MLAKKYPELENPIRSARKMSWLDKWRDIQFHRGLAKTDERMLHEQIKEDSKIEIAKKAFAEGSPPEFVQKITGLDMEIIQKLSSSP